MANDSNKPTLTEVQINAVAELYTSGKLDEAIAEIKSLNKDYPNVPLLFNILGACYQAKGLLIDSAQMFETATKIKPDYAEAHFNLGVVLKASGKIKEAIECYKKAIYLVPNYPAAHNNLGNMYKDLNQLDDAIKSYESAIAIKPDYAEAHHNLSLIKVYTYDDSHIQKLESLLSDKDIDTKNKVFLNFSLANIYEDLGNVEKQIKFLNEACAIKKNESNYTFDISSKLLTSITSLFQDSTLDKNSLLEPISSCPIFILGMPRSGTSLVEQIISSHEQVNGLGELKILSQCISVVVNNNSSDN